MLERVFERPVKLHFPEPHNTPTLPHPQGQKPTEGALVFILALTPRALPWGPAQPSLSTHGLNMGSELRMGTPQDAHMGAQGLRRSVQQLQGSSRDPRVSLHWDLDVRWARGQEACGSWSCGKGRARGGGRPGQGGQAGDQPRCSLSRVKLAELRSLSRESVSCLCSLWSETRIWEVPPG